MAFSDETKAAAFERSGGRCECTRSSCSTHYLSRCPTSVTLYSAEYHHKKDHSMGDVDRVDNCEVLCNACSQQAAMDLFKA